MQEFFSPINIAELGNADAYTDSAYGNLIAIHTENEFPELEGANIALIGVEEDRRSINNEGCALAPNYVRQHLYALYQGDFKSNIIDLGNIKAGSTIEDTYFALTEVLTTLLKKNIVPIIMGGGQDLTHCNYLAYKSLEQTINVAAVDACFDMGDKDEELNSRNYLTKIILDTPNILFNFSNIGYQTYFVEQSTVEMMNKMYFDANRLGQMRENMENVEPIVRNADMLSFDMGAIRHSDASGNSNASPNGFYGEEACQIARYAGMSDKLSSIGFYELNPAFDTNKQTAFLLAQMIWYFIDGYYNRKDDFPIVNKDEYTKYRVALTNHDHEIVFYKSNRSDRWWMDVPYPPNHKVKYERHHMTPCSYNDYETACSDEMPDNWWKTYQKLG